MTTMRLTQNVWHNFCNVCDFKALQLWHLLKVISIIFNFFSCLTCIKIYLKSPHSFIWKISFVPSSKKLWTILYTYFIICWKIKRVMLLLRAHSHLNTLKIIFIRMAYLTSGILNNVDKRQLTRIALQWRKMKSETCRQIQNKFNFNYYNIFFAIIIIFCINSLSLE